MRLRKAANASHTDREIVWVGQFNTDKESNMSKLEKAVYTGKTEIEKVLYTGKTHTTGGREGTARSDDGHLDIKLTRPGGAGAGTNPEQLFAAGWSACFIGALAKAAQARAITLPADVAIDAEVDLAMTGDAYFLQARLNVSLPGFDRETALSLAKDAHQRCPYSKATSGNINVVIDVV